MLRLKTFPLAKKFMDKRGGGNAIKIFRQNFFLSQFRKISQGNPSVFHCFRVSKKVRDKRSGWGYLRFTVENVLSQST